MEQIPVLILIRSWHEVDRKIVSDELTPLVELKEEPEILDRIQQLFEPSNP